MPFSPDRLQYRDDSGVPYLRRLEIWAIVDGIIEENFPEVRDEPTVFPPDKLVALIQSHGAKVRIRDLGKVGSYKVFGLTGFEDKTIYLDDVLRVEKERSFRFTLAHEFGHWLLHRHRPLVLGEASEYGDQIHDTESSLYKIRKEEGLKSPREWIEWQANEFASALIMPKNACKNAVFNMQMSGRALRHPVVINRGIIYLNKGETGIAEARQQVRAVADYFFVSERAMRYRLERLGLIEKQDGANWGDDY